MRPLPPTWVSLPVSSSMWARVTPTRNPSGRSSQPQVERLVVLTDLVVLGLVGVEVVLAGEGAGPDVRVQRRPDPHGQLDRLGVEHRQGAGQPEADRADVGVGLVAERVATAAEKLGPGGQLAMHLEADHHLPAVARSVATLIGRRRLHRRGHPEQQGLLEGRGQDLHPDRQSVVPPPKGTDTAG